MTKIASHLTLTLSLLIASPLLLAQESPVEENIAEDETTTSSTVSLPDLLDQKVPDYEKVLLNTSSGQQLGFYLNEMSGKVYGGVLLITDIDHHPAANGIINSLRHSLAKNHWHTLALKINGNNTEETQQLIAAGINHLNQQGIYNLAILGEGFGAAHALNYVAAIPPEQFEKNKNNQLRAILLLNGNNEIPSSDIEILEQLELIQIPILDAYTNNNYQEQKQATQRQQAAHRLMNQQYQQIRLPQVSSFSPKKDNLITKRIRGWLDNNVAGLMIDRK